MAEERFDELDKRRLRSDFLSQVREVCRLHLAKDPLTRDAEIEEVDGVRFDHLVVSYHRGPWHRLAPAVDQRVGDLGGNLGQAGLAGDLRIMPTSGLSRWWRQCPL